MDEVGVPCGDQGDRRGGQPPKRDNDPGLVDRKGLSSADHRALATLLRGATAKGYRLGTRRARHPEDTLRDVQPLLAGAGITRVANVTGLDRIGIPVFMVVRPNSRSVAVSQGKGVEAVAARVSGIMECLETQVAELPCCPTVSASWTELSRRANVIDPAALPMAPGSVFAAEAHRLWAEGYDIAAGGAAWVPLALVHTSFLEPPVAASGCFRGSTNGLASGNSLVEAVLHGLCEVVERDATATWKAGRRRALEGTRLDLATVDDRGCRDLIALCDAAEIDVMAWSMETVAGVAAIRVVLRDRLGHALDHPVPAALGYGCHLERDVAFSRALTEAAQTRLTTIAGSRDDLTRRSYDRIQRPEVFEFHRRTAEASGDVDFRQIPSSANATLEDDVAAVLDGLGARGFLHVVVVDLTPPELPIKVVRVIVPGLTVEGATVRRPPEDVSP